MLPVVLVGSMSYVHYDSNLAPPQNIQHAKLSSQHGLVDDVWCEGGDEFFGFGGVWQVQCRIQRVHVKLIAVRAKWRLRPVPAGTTPTRNTFDGARG